MTGRITRLIDDQQLGTITGEDGMDYSFRSGTLITAAFGSLHLGAKVTFEPDATRHRAAAVRVESGDGGRFK